MRILTDCLIHGTASSWSKVRLAASRSTVKAPAFGGTPLRQKKQRGSDQFEWLAFSLSFHSEASFYHKSWAVRRTRTHLALVKQETRLELVKNIAVISLLERNEVDKLYHHWSYCSYSIITGILTTMGKGPLCLSIAVSHCQPFLQLLLIQPSSYPSLHRALKGETWVTTSNTSSLKEKYWYIFVWVYKLFSIIPAQVKHKWSLHSSQLRSSCLKKSKNTHLSLLLPSDITGKSTQIKFTSHGQSEMCSDGPL